MTSGSNSYCVINDAVREDAQVLWNYHVLKSQVQPADFVLALGSHDLRVARWAAKLIRDGLAPLLVVSGGQGRVTSGLWSETEADRFAEVALQAGVPEAQILREAQAKNTGDNIVLSRDVLVDVGVDVASGILVTKPYMMRRALATATKQWGEIEWQVAAPPLSYAEYPAAEVPEDRMINLMVGDLQRIDVYAKTGLQSPQEVPNSVWDSYRRLVKAGFDEHVLSEET